MEIREYYEMIRKMLEDAESIIHHQMVIAGIHEELKQRRMLPFETDEIYRDHFGTPPFEPIEHTVAGVTFTTTILHREGTQLRDIKGADLLYEIKDEKYILVQYKKANSSGRVRANSAQLDTLLNNCPAICYYKKRPRDYIPIRMNGYCGCFYRIENNNEKRYVHACEAKTLFGTRNSATFREFSSGISKETFVELFAKCRLGAMTQVKKSYHYVNLLKQQNHFIMHIVQSGKFYSSNQ